MSATAVMPAFGAVAPNRARTHTSATRAEQLWCAYFTALPLLWVTGLTLPLAFMLVLGTLLACVRSRRAVVLAAPWFLVAACQLAAVVFNMSRAGQPPMMLLKHLLASYVSGWFLIGSAVAIGASGVVRPVPFLHAVARIGWSCMALATMVLPLAFVWHDQTLFLLSPIGTLLPEGLPSRSFYFGMVLFTWEPLFGIPTPRLATLFPWATALGFGGMCLAFVLLNEENRRRRRLGLLGAAVMLVGSLGRMAFLATIAAASLRWLLLRSPRTRMALMSIGLVVVCAGGLIGIATRGSLDDAAAVVRTRLEETRPGASEAREKVYEESWAGFHASPWLGNGWPGDPVYAVDNADALRTLGTMVPGSHSTYLGSLYLGGIVTLTAFVFALLWTMFALLAAHRARTYAANTVALLAGIAMVATSESLASLALPSLFAFLWIGIALHATRTSETLR